MHRNPDPISPTNVRMMVHFTVEEGQSDKFIENIKWLIETMSSEPTFVRATLHRGLEVSNAFILYEEWRKTKEEWVNEETDKPYRQVAAKKDKGVLESKHVEFIGELYHWERH